MKNKILVLILGVFLIGCSEQKVSGTFRKQFEGELEINFPQAMEYVIKDDRIVTFTTISYSEDENTAESMGNLQVESYVKEFGKQAVSMQTSFDVNEQYYKAIVVVDYSKIEETVLQKYIKENKESKEAILTVDSIYNFDEYEKINE